MTIPFDARTTRFATAGRVVLYVLALFTVAACTRSSPPESPAVQTAPAEANTEARALRLATFNTEFLFDGEGNEGQTGFDRSGDPEAARRHLERVAHLVRGLDADVVMLQEVENEAVLQQLVRGPLQDLDYTAHFVQGTDHFTGQDIGLLSRLPVDEVGRTDDRAPVAGSPGEDYGVSKNMYARLRMDGQPVTLVGLHFLARPDDTGRRPKREAQAEVIRRFVAAESAAGRAVVVLGDFNDFDRTVQDVAGSQPITDVLQIIKRAGPGAEDDLRNAMNRTARARRYTSFYDRNRDDAVDPATEYSAIDHVLLSPALYRRIQSVRFANDHDPVRGPDHFPIVVTLGTDAPSRQAAD